MPSTIPRKISAKPRPVDFFEQRGDHDCALFGAMGFSTDFIQRRTGLSHSQIAYRLHKAGLTRDNGTSRMDFRNGSSPFAAPLLNAARPIIDRDLMRFIKANL